MTRGQNRGRGNNNSTRGTPRGRGGRGGGRGRGRGGAAVRVDHTLQSFDYADLLDEEMLGFNPSPVYQPPLQPQAQQSPYQSGYSTPNRGRRRGRGGFTPGGGRGGSSSGTNSPGSGFGGFASRGRGRGGGIGATGGGNAGFNAFSTRGRGGRGAFSSGTASSRGGGVVGMGGAPYNPLLVPVKFVKASSAGLGTVGGEDDHTLDKAGAEAPKPWQLEPFEEAETSGVDGALADGVEKLGLTGETDTLSPTVEDVEHFEPAPETTATMAVDEIEEAHEGAMPQGHRGLGSHPNPAPSTQSPPSPAPAVASSTPPAPVAAPPSPPPADEDEPPLFEISTTRSEVHVELADSLPPPPALAAYADDGDDDDDEEDDSDSDDDQIVYPTRAVSHADPVLAPRPRPTAPSSLPSATLPVSQPKSASATTRAPPPPPQPKQNKKALKRASRAARKAGRQHARSGNAHLLAAATEREEQTLGGLDDEEEDEEAARDKEDGRALFARLQSGSGGVDDMLPADSDDDSGDDVLPSTAEAHEDGQPRLNDSDVDWGSDAPPPVRKALRGKGKRDQQRQQRADQREVEKLERLVAAGATREEVEMGLAMERSLREEEERVGEKERRRRERRERDERRAEEDYVANLAGGGGDDDEALDVDAMQAFARGVAGSLGGHHERGDDLDNRAAEDAEEDEDEWGTSEDDSEDEEDDSSEEGSSEIDEEEAYRRSLALEEEDSDEVDSDVELEMDYSLGDADGRVEHSLSLASTSGENTSFDSSLSSSTDSDVEQYEFESALLSGQTVRLQSIGQGGGGGRKAERERKKERARARKGKGRAVEIVDEDEDEDSDEDEDEQLFRGKNTWADDDEAFIRRMQRTVALNGDLLETAAGGKAARRANRKERKKLFKAISEGNFDDFDGGEEMDDLDDEIEAMLMDEEEGMGWGAGPSKKQRKKDKTFNGAFSAQLAATWDKDRQKKASKKAERAALRAAAVEAESRDAFKGGSKKGKKSAAAAAAAAAEFENDAATVNTRIRHFITVDISSTSLSLPPMSKKSRIAVHLLAELYGLKSRSLGSGKNRFPVLERTQRTTVAGVSERRVRAIVGTADGEDEMGGGWSRPRGGKMLGLWKALEGADRKGGGGKRGGGGAGRNNEGAVVGQGADRIGADNVGFALLKKMGWTEGAQIGSSQNGLLEPIAARVKTNKQGLGSGFAVNRRQAQEMARAPERDWDE
ncbi:hypothetical protein JCM6882_001785 [Rhodosporidiobolus microsporus]